MSKIREEFVDDGFIFRREYWKLIKELNPDDQVAALKAILNYGCLGDLLEIEGIAKAVFELCKPLIDLDNSRLAGLVNCYEVVV